jgi:hypothetical protein
LTEALSPLPAFGVETQCSPIAELIQARLDEFIQSRLDEFMRLSHAVVVAPGGIGTLLELFYVWQLLQVGLLAPRPVILLGAEFWHGLVQWMREQQFARQFVSLEDLECISIVRSTEEAVVFLLTEQLRFESTSLALPDTIERSRMPVPETASALEERSRSGSGSPLRASNAGSL